MPSRSPSPRTSAAATVIRRRRTYSDSGIPASDENIRRRWYSVVPRLDARPATSRSSVEVLLHQVDEPVEPGDHGPPSTSTLPERLDRHPTIAVRSDRIHAGVPPASRSFTLAVRDYVVALHPSLTDLRSNKLVVGEESVYLEGDCASQAPGALGRDHYCVAYDLRDGLIAAIRCYGLG